MITPITQAQVGQINTANGNAPKSVKAEETCGVKTKVDEIKEQIAKGEYKIDLKKTAEKVAEELL
ncbi:MAG: flagellar biosynthesis anti-sigma factor FlgM [Helicobacteraceae bacterium]|jgi:anti-sigma28 factor (negative regulator of flagellin synthesis)|nr:flagellar biosynthesis anti-sigma factor FlgM [Helicobacteraceae bacterium]